MTKEEENIDKLACRKNPFTVPDGYFSELQANILKNIPAAEVKSIKPQKRNRYLVPIISVAASVCILIVGAAVFFNSENNESANKQIARVEPAQTVVVQPQQLAEVTPQEQVMAEPKQEVSVAPKQMKETTPVQTQSTSLSDDEEFCDMLAADADKAEDYILMGTDDMYQYITEYY